MEKAIGIPGVAHFHVTGTTKEDLLEKSTFDRIWFIRIRQGFARAQCNYSGISLPEGSTWLLADQIPFRFLSASDDLQAEVVSMSIRFLDSVYFSIGPLMPPTMSVVSTEQMNQCHTDLIASGFKLLSQTLEAPLEVGREEMLRSLATHLLLAFSAGYSSLNAEDQNPTVSGKHQGRMNEFISLILGGSLPHRRDAEYYAAKLGISTRYLFRISKEITGQSPKQIIDGILIGGIKQALSAGVRPIGDIALDYGFEDQTAFGQYFKRHTGSTPSAFRKQYK